MHRETGKKGEGDDDGDDHYPKESRYSPEKKWLGFGYFGVGHECERTNISAPEIGKNLQKQHLSDR
jgi:hypothetical protein